MNPRRLAALISLAAALAVAGCGSSGSGGESGHTHDDAGSAAIIETDSSTSPSEFRGGEVEPVTAAPALDLRSQDGKKVRMADFRGKVVLVSFLYTRCPDICPVILQKMHNAQTKLGAKAKDTAIVVISVDPKGDTPAAVRTYLAKRNLTGHVTWLVGDATELGAAWKRWGVIAAESPTDPDLVEHSGVVWLVDAEGNRRGYYPLSAIEPDDIVHDATRLLTSSGG